MKNISKNTMFVIVLSIFLFLFVAGCSSDGGGDDDAVGTNAVGNDIDNKISSMAQLENDPVVDPAEYVSTEEEEYDEEIEGKEYKCTIKKYKIAPEYNEMIVMDPTTNIFYPGSLINGESIADGTYTPIITDRKPIIISVSLENIEGSVSATIDDPTLSSVRQGLHDILAQNLTGTQPAYVSFEIEEVYSIEQLQIALGAHFGFNSGLSKASLDTAFSNNSTEETSQFLVKFIQKFYTVDLDLPSRPSDFFDGPIPDNALDAISPMYISTVVYGRIALFSAVSNYSSQDVKAALDAAFDSGVYEGEINVDVDKMDILNQATIKGSIIGGSGSGASGVITGIDGLIQYITSGGDYSKDNPGAPIAYVLRYLANNNVTKIVMGTEYNVRDCELVPVGESKKVKIELIKIEVVGSDDSSANESDPYGWVKMEGDYFWNISQDEWINGHNIIDIANNMLVATPLFKTFTDIQGDETIEISWRIYDFDPQNADDLLAKGTSKIPLSVLEDNSAGYTFISYIYGKPVKLTFKTTATVSTP